MTCISSVPFTVEESEQQNVLGEREVFTSVGRQSNSVSTELTNFQNGNKCLMPNGFNSSGLLKPFTLPTTISGDQGAMDMNTISTTAVFSVQLGRAKYPSEFCFFACHRSSMSYLYWTLLPQVPSSAQASQMHPWTPPPQARMSITVKPILVIIPL